MVIYNYCELKSIEFEFYRKLQMNDETSKTKTNNFTNIIVFLSFFIYYGRPTVLIIQLLTSKMYLQLSKDTKMLKKIKKQ